MNTNSIRPRVEQLALCLYDRPIHPELIETVALRRIRRRDFALTVRLTPSGHVLSWECPELHLTEVASESSQPLPQGGRLLHRRLHTEQAETVIPMAGFCYQIAAQIETLSPEVYPHVHQEIVSESDRGGLTHFYSPQHRLAIPPISVAVQDSGPDFVSVSTFHTFPDELAVVKTQTLIEFGL